ncbi:unnamed protein product, partial [Musa acuminata subsp. burmannicoides]
CFREQEGRKHIKDSTTHLRPNILNITTQPKNFCTIPCEKVYARARFHHRVISSYNSKL